MLKIKDVFDLNSPLYKQCDTYRSKFSKIAHTILKHFKIVCNGNGYSVEELEFYYHDPTLHSDPYMVHHKDQQESANWYFNKRKSSYCGGKNKGLSITFGYNDKKQYGYVLIKSIYDLTNDILIEGPNNVVDTLLTVSKSKSVKKLVKKFDSMSIRKKNNTNLYCTMINSDMKITKSQWHGFYGFCKGPRVGLDLHKSNLLKERFIMRPYRYIGLKEKIIKVKGKQIIYTPQPIPQSFIYNMVLNKYFFGIDELTMDTFKRYGIVEEVCDKWMEIAEKGVRKKYTYFCDRDLLDEDLVQLYGLWLSTHGLTDPMSVYDPEDYESSSNLLYDSPHNQVQNTTPEYSYTTVDPETNTTTTTNIRRPTGQERIDILNSVIDDEKVFASILKNLYPHGIPDGVIPSSVFSDKN